MAVTTNSIITGVNAIDAPIFTGPWSGLSAFPAASFAGRKASITSPFRGEFVSDGTDWFPVNGSCVLLNQVTDGGTVTGTLVQTVLQAFSLPGGVLGATGTIVADYVVSGTGTAGTKGFALRYGGTVLSDFSAISATLGGRFIQRFSNTAVAVQRGTDAGILAGVSSGNTSAFRTGAVNSAVAQDISVAVTLASAADSMTLKSLLITLYK